jgi:hypothetical protein
MRQFFLTVPPEIEEAAIMDRQTSWITGTLPSSAPSTGDSCTGVRELEQLPGALIYLNTPQLFPCPLR